jgi:hypothetical protein
MGDVSMTQQRRPIWPGIAGAALTLALVGACAQVATSAARTAAVSPAAGAARALSVNDTGYLHLLNASGSVLSEEGSVSGTLPGKTRVRLNVGASVTASFTINSRGGGSITGHGSAVLHSSGRYSSFAGSLSVKQGTGRYAHAHGAGKLYGVIDRRTDNLTVQTIGTLHY